MGEGKDGDAAMGEDGAAEKDGENKEPKLIEKVELEDDDINRLFEHLDEDGEGTISREAFMRLIGRFMKVVKETVMTVSRSIQDKKSVRRLKEKEVVEVIEGPFTDANFGVSRLCARAVSDGSEGWVTMCGNQ